MYAQFHINDDVFKSYNYDIKYSLKVINIVTS